MELVIEQPYNQYGRQFFYEKGGSNLKQGNDSFLLDSTEVILINKDEQSDFSEIEQNQYSAQKSTQKSIQTYLIRFCRKYTKTSLVHGKVVTNIQVIL